MQLINSRFDPRVGRWEEVCPMSTTRFGHGSAVLHSELYVAGGVDERLEDLSSAEKYDPRTNMWTSAADMSSSEGFLRLATVNGKLYATNADCGKSVEVFDPKANQWKHHSDMNCRHTHSGVAVLQKL
nr:Kelch repeat type 1 domain containing protein [Haemonchus contortus]